MSRNITSIAINTPLVEAADIIRQQHLSSAVIVEHGLPIGIISERDMSCLCADLLAGGTAPELVKLMSPGVVSIMAEHNCEQAAQLMTKKKIKQLIVTDSSGKLCGVFNYSDLLRARRHEIEQQYEQTVHRVFQLNQSLEESNARLQLAAKQDVLLQVGNRSAMDDALSKVALSEAEYSVAVIDIDYFKLYNDYYNHAKGDATLIRVCRTAEMELGQSARIYRQSGNTLLALFVGQQHSENLACANSLLSAVNMLAIDHYTAPLGKISVSIGIACSASEGHEPNHVVFRALNARDQAKHKGGNQLIENSEPQRRAA